MSSYVWGVIQSTCICIYLFSTESVLRHVFHRTRYRLHNIHVFQTIYFRWLLCLGTAVTSYIDYFHFRTYWYLSVVFWFLHHISTIDIIAICSHGFFSRINYDHLSIVDIGCAAGSSHISYYHSVCDVVVQSRCNYYHYSIVDTEVWMLRFPWLMSTI